MKSLMTYLNSKKTPQLTFEVFFYVFFFTKTHISTIFAPIGLIFYPHFPKSPISTSIWIKIITSFS